MKSNTYQYNATSELQILYTSLLNDIQFYKNQQWSITNYIILIQAGLVGMSKVLENTHFRMINFFLIMLSFLIMAVGLILFFQFEEDRKASHEIKKEIVKKFSPQINNYLEKLNDIRNSDGENKSDYIKILLITIISTSPLIVSLIILIQYLQHFHLFWFIHH